MEDKKKVMVITGASSGVGKALSLYFDSKGYSICALGRSRDKLEVLQKESNKNLHTYPVDVSKSKQVIQTFREIISDFDRIDVLINNAGIIKFGNYWEQRIEDIDQMIDVNLKGTLYCTYAALNYTMIPKRGGRIINISSVAGIRTSPKSSVYQASKHGQVGFGFSIAQALIPYNILVTTLCPGGINTPLWLGKDAPVTPEGIRPKDFMNPDELSEAIEFILERPSTTLWKQMVFFPTWDWD